MLNPTKDVVCRKISFAACRKLLGLRCLHSLRLSLSNVAAAEPSTDNPSHYATPFIVYDTAKSTKCGLSTRRQNILSWYSCGPTVYDSAHIGHASSFIRQDVIRRILEGINKDVTVIQVMGITDIDDKIIKKANETNVEWSSVSKYYEREFKEDLSNLNVIPPHAFTRVSDYIPQILQFVGKLVETGFAYPVPDGSVYFDVEKYGKRYGVFRQALSSEDVQETALSSDGKKNSRDFALWKGSKPGEPYWSSPWGSGKGRPGWHIECSVMATQFFGQHLDIHTGGRDLIFPHHENEEAQCCAHFQSSRWTSHWLHMGHLHFKGDVKMSKSLGNTVSIRSFLKEHSVDVLRIMCIMGKYRKNIEYSPDAIDIAEKILKRLRIFLSDTTAILNGTKPVKLDSNLDETCLWGNLAKAKSELNAALLNDFDTSTALKVVSELISDFNRHYVPYNSNCISNTTVNLQLVLAIKIFVQDFLQLVGLSLSAASISSESSFNDTRLESVITQFVQFRNQVRTYSLAMSEDDKQARKQKITERKELLQACDKARDNLLAESSVEIKDHGKTSTWSFAESNTQRK